MKHFTLGALLLLAGAANAQVFESDLEAWTEGTPDDFMGVKTSILPENVIQVTENAHGGSFAVQLINTATVNSDHKRFTTQPLSVTAGQTYDVTAWARGTGEVRFGMFDERAGNGYSSYSAFTVVNSTEWQQITFSVQAANTTEVAEFIFSVVRTVEPAHLILDDVNISAGVVIPPTDATISEIQTTIAPDGASPLVGTNVRTQGIITGIVTNSSGAGTSFFIQDGAGAFSGVYVFGSPGTAVVGDEVSVVATVTEYGGPISAPWPQTYTELTNIIEVTVLSSGNAAPAAETLTAGDWSAEAWEAVLVKVMNVQCTNLPTAENFMEWNASNWQGNVLVNDLLYAYTPTVGTAYSVTGIVDYAFSAWKLEPRAESDIELGVVGINELNNTSIVLFPNPAAATVTLDLSDLSGRTEYTLHDAHGRMVMADVATAVRTTLDVSGLTNGLYVVTLRNNGATTSTRLAVQH
ncbi:MAG: T9SS type A sorting domain-containing protein [Flavobacteriales bacterium]|nr:T9SS type A sorting domain-containing protein [Flavobacteriales bacterium]